MTEKMLGELGGRKSRERRAGGGSPVIELGFEIMEKYSKGPSLTIEQEAEMRDLVEQKDLDVTEGELKNVIRTFSENKGPYPQRKAIGVYTGILFGMLKPEKFYVNGEGRRFDFLLRGAENIDELVVDNFRGDYIGEYNKGGNKIRVLNCKGEDALAGSGSIKELHIINHTGLLRPSAHYGETHIGYMERFITINAGLGYYARKDAEVFVNVGTAGLGIRFGAKISVDGKEFEYDYGNDPKLNLKYTEREPSEEELARQVQNDTAHKELTGMSLHELCETALRMREMETEELIRTADMISELYK